MGPVTEQSEHLSNAQIENYGIRTSGAGPDPAQRDEHQRANHQSIDDQKMNDQRVEAHLADCPPCRNRLFDFHRRLFALPAGPPETDPPENDPTKNDVSLSGPKSADSNERSADSKLASARPTDSALADSKFANSKYPAGPQVRTAPTPECPSDDALRQLAASLTPDALAARLTQHAATCDHCGPLLRTFTEDFSDDFTADEQAALASLQSSSADWQKNTARKMLDAGGVQTSTAPATDEQTAPQKSSSKPTTERKPFFWKWVLVPAIAAVVAVAAITFPVYLARRDSPEKVDKLLAQASTEQRLLDIRFPGAAYASLKQRRSGASESILATPIALDQAKTFIKSELTKNPESQHWLIMQARLDLLDWRYRSAQVSIRKAEQFGSETQDLLLTRAMVNYEVSEAESQPQNYAYAVNDLGKFLEQQPDDTVALFNRALILEKLNWQSSAREDWEHFLRIEKDPGWIAEAKAHLSQLDEKKNPNP